MKWKKEGKFGVICINPIPNPQSPIPNPSTRNLQKIFAKFIFIFFKLNLKKIKRWGLWIGIHGFGLKIGWGSNL